MIYVLFQIDSAFKPARQVFVSAHASKEGAERARDVILKQSKTENKEDPKLALKRSDFKLERVPLN